MKPEDFSLVGKYLLLLLSANSNESIPGKLWYQKELFMLSKNIPELWDEADFEPYLWGPYSEVADDEMEELRKLGLIESDSFKLTIQGEKIAKQISVNKNQEELVKEMKDFLNGLSKDELLLFIYSSYPEVAEDSVEIKPLLPKRKEIAMGLYTKNKISVGKAAEMAGISVDEMITELKKKGILRID